MSESISNNGCAVLLLLALGTVGFFLYLISRVKYG